MSGYVGSDPYRVEQLGAALQHSAERLDDIRSRLTGALHHSTWVGYDAHEAREEWAVSHGPALSIAAELLREMSRIAYANAHEQRVASQSDSGSSFAPMPYPIQIIPPGPGVDRDFLGFLDLLSNLNIFVDLAGIGMAVIDTITPALQLGGVVLGALGLPISAFQLGLYIGQGDAGGIILTLGSIAVTSTGLAIAAGLITLSAPAAAVAGIGLGVAALGLTIASNTYSIRNWVGDRWDDGVHFTESVIDEVTQDVRDAWDATVEVTGNVVEGVVEGAVGFGKSVYDFIF